MVAILNSDGGAGLPAQWAFDADGNLTVTSTHVPGTETGSAILIDVSGSDDGATALYANGCLNIDMTGRFQSALVVTPSEVDGNGNVLFARMTVVPDQPGLLPNIFLTDDHSPGSAGFGYGGPSGITSAFDPPPGQAIFDLRLGDPAYTGNLIQCRDGNGNHIFEVRANGNLHIKTGATVIADL